MLLHKRNLMILTWSLVPLLLVALHSEVEGETTEARGEIRVVESWRPDINVLGHNVLQSLFEYALDKNELAPSLAISRKWIDDVTLEVKLRHGVHFHNGEPFDAYAAKFNFDYQRKHNPSRGVQFYMSNLKEIQIVDPYKWFSTNLTLFSWTSSSLALSPAGSLVHQNTWNKLVGRNS
jgi:ABC-type transport system substrate-binding protein